MSLEIITCTRNYPNKLYKYHRKKKRGVSPWFLFLKIHISFKISLKYIFLIFFFKNLSNIFLSSIFVKFVLQSLNTNLSYSIHVWYNTLWLNSLFVHFQKIFFFFRIWIPTLIISYMSDITLCAYISVCSHSVNSVLRVWY